MNPFIIIKRILLGDDCKLPYKKEDYDSILTCEHKKSQKDNFYYGTRVYSESDVVPWTARRGSLSWVVREIDDKESCKRILNHLRTSTEIRVYISNYHGEVICGFYTKQFGWVKCHMHNRLNFGVYKNGIRYDIKYGCDLRVISPELSQYISKMHKRWHNEWSNDYNL